jgi:hypothetical protein
MRALQIRNTKPDLQRRFAALDGLKVDASSRTFDGYASVFGVRDTYGTTFVKGCFDRTLKEWRAKGKWPDFCLMHDWSTLIGAFEEMREDDRGLYVRGRYVRSPFGDHGLALLAEGIATGLSVGFITQAITTAAEITDVDLYEVSQCSNPSNREAGITGMRGLIHAESTRREVERALRDIGAPRDAAKAMASMWAKGEARDVPDPEPEAQARDARAEPTLAELIRSAAATLKG